MNDKQTIPTDHDNALRSYFSDGPSPLPSNFSWRVMQAVYQLKIQRARQRATLDSILVSAVSLIAVTIVLAAYFAYTGSEAWQLPVNSSFVLPAAVALTGYLLIDSLIGIFHQREQQS